MYELGKEAAYKRRMGWVWCFWGPHRSETRLGRKEATGWGSSLVGPYLF